MLDPLEQQRPPGRDRAERVGVWISGVGHTVLVLWAIIGGALFAADDSPPVEMTEVTTISNQQFEEMAARSRGAGPVGQADGDAPAQPQTPGDTSAPEGPEVALQAPEPDTTAAALPQPLQDVLARVRQRGVPVRVTAVGASAPVQGADLVLADREGRLRQRWGIHASGGAYLLRPDQHVCARWLTLDATRLQAAFDQALPSHAAET